MKKQLAVLALILSAGALNAAEEPKAPTPVCKPCTMTAEEQAYCNKLSPTEQKNFMMMNSQQRAEMMKKMPEKK
jgi:predicted Fe-S protein YdhL (DUF1289 family)